MKNIFNRYIMMLLVLIPFSGVVKAGDAVICQHYLGATATMTQGTDTGPISCLYYGEACAFKFNIQLTVYNSPWHVGSSYPDPAYERMVSDTKRMDYEIYMQTVEGNAGDLTYPYGTNVVERQVSWHYDQYGYVAALCSYQGGQYSYADYIHEYILAGRDSDFDSGYEYGATDKINTRHYKNSTRHGDDPDPNAIITALGILDTAIANNGWFRDFMHWHTNPIYDATLYQLLEGMQVRASSNRIATVSTGTAIQHRWLRDNATVNLSTNGSSLEIAVTYTMPDWMYTEWVGLNLSNSNNLRPIDAFLIPLSVKVDLSGTILDGNELTASGATSLRKLVSNEFVVEVPFNRTNETVTAILSATNNPVYANENLPVIGAITRTGDDWQVVTDQKTRLVVFSLPAGMTLEEIKAKEGADPDKRVDSPENLRFNTFVSTHSFTLPDSATRDYYIGIMTEQHQSILQPLSPMSGEDPVIVLQGDNPQHLFVDTVYIELGATAQDNVDGDITSNIVIDASDVNMAVTGTYSVTYNVTDSDTNAAIEVIRTVNVTEDTTPPVITLLGDNPQYITISNAYVEAGATAIDDKDGDVSSNIVIDASAVDTTVAGTYEVTYNVSDAASNTSPEVIRSVVVTIEETGFQALTFLAHLNDNSSWNINTNNHDVALGDKTATITGSPLPDTGFFPPLSSTPATWSLTFTNSGDKISFAGFDGNIDYLGPTGGGITVGCWFKIQGGGYVAAEIFNLGYAGEYLKVNYGYGQGGKARLYFYDDGVGTILDSVTDTASHITDWVCFVATVNLSDEELVLRQYDDEGNELASDTISTSVIGWDIKDNASSKITLGGGMGGNANRIYIDEFFIDGRVLADAEIQNRVTSMVAGTELASSGIPPGEDTTPPVITLIGDNPQNVIVSNAYVELGATALDNVDGDITSNIVIDASAVNTAVTGTYYVTYNVDDAATNSAVEVIRTVNVIVLGADTNPPVITLIGDNPQNITVGNAYVELGATAQDDIDGDISSNIVIDASSVNTALVGDYSVTYNVSDAAGNPADEVVRTVKVVAETVAGLTFLSHFNDTSSWDLNTANGDYATGSSVATVSGLPVWADGFFPGSMPGNKALCFYDASQKLDYLGNDGNLPISNPVGSVMTVGFWCKMTGMQKGRPLMIRSGDYKNYLMFDFGNAMAGKWSIFFMDYTLDESAQAQTQIKPNIDVSAYITNWMYLATVIDTGSKIARIYQYDNAGNLIGSPYNKSLTVYSWDLTNGVAKIAFNYTYYAGTTNYIDEFSIDNYELTQSEIQARVDNMVNGKEINNVQPAGMYMIIR